MLACRKYYKPPKWGGLISQATNEEKPTLPWIGPPHVRYYAATLVSASQLHSRLDAVIMDAADDISEQPPS